jgi:hypothetical protein
MLMRRLSQHDSLLVRDHHISDLKLFEENPMTEDKEGGHDEEMG